MIFSRFVLLVLNYFDYFQQYKMIKLIKEKFSKPIVVFDIGAHYGETVNLLNKKLDIDIIYSFEASPKNFEILKKNQKKLNSKKFKIYNFGLGEELSEKFINQTIESSSSTINNINLESKYFQRKLNVLNIKDKNLFQQKLPVKIITLDYFIEKENINYIDLLKIDTEGYEFNILKGISKFYKKVRLIYLEHHYDDMIIKNYKFGDIHRLLKNYGFKKIKKSKMFFRKSFEYIYENTRFS